MAAAARGKRVALIGYVVAAAGVLIFTQLSEIPHRRSGFEVVNFTVVGGFVATVCGFITALVGSIMWGRQTRTRQPVAVAAAVAVASFLVCLLLNVNVHGPSVILIFVVLLSTINALVLLLAS